MPGIISVTMAYVSEEWASGGAAAVMAAYVAGNVLGGVTGRFLVGPGRFAFWLALGIYRAGDSQRCGRDGRLAMAAAGKISVAKCRTDRPAEGNGEFIFAGPSCLPRSLPARCLVQSGRHVYLHHVSSGRTALQSHDDCAGFAVRRVSGGSRGHARAADGGSNASAIVGR